MRENLKIRVTGTVGLILWEKRAHALTVGECRELYNRFLQSSFWIKKEILQGLIK